MIKGLCRCLEGTLPLDWHLCLYICSYFLIIDLREVCFNRNWSFSLTPGWGRGAYVVDASATKSIPLSERGPPCSPAYMTSHQSVRGEWSG